MLPRVITFCNDKVQLGLDSIF